MASCSGWTLSLAIIVCALPWHFTQAQDEHTFVFKHDMLKGESGYFTVDGHTGVSPELEMELNVEYTFMQLDATNWYHPLGFAYYPDGALNDVDELEADIGNGDAPVYYVDNVTSDLDTYEPAFKLDRGTWKQKQYMVKLTVTDPNVTEIFYFCHIHSLMSGRIKIKSSAGDGTSAIALYQPYMPSTFDETCGTFEAGEYDPDGNYDKYCEGSQFLCGEDSQFVQCMRAIDCKMMHEMKVTNDVDPVITFMHQMIPHHVNAVNMAKILYKQKKAAKHLVDNPDSESEDSKVYGMLMDIMNTQNEQITYMRKYLKDHEASVVPCVAEGKDDKDGKDGEDGKSAGIRSSLTPTTLLVAIFAPMMLGRAVM